MSTTFEKGQLVLVKYPVSDTVLNISNRDIDYQAHNYVHYLLSNKSLSSSCEIQYNIEENLEDYIDSIQSLYDEVVSVITTFKGITFVLYSDTIFPIHSSLLTSINL